MTLCSFVIATPFTAYAATPPSANLVADPEIIITEFQTNGTKASEEFIELYNNTDSDILLSDSSAASSSIWKLQFFNSTSVKSGLPVWNTNATASNSISLTGTIAAHDYFLVGSQGYEPAGVKADLTYIASGSRLMTDTGGGLQVINHTTSNGTSQVSAHDRVMWLASSSTIMPPLNVYKSPIAGSSLQRLTYDDKYTDSDGQTNNYESKTEITPLRPWVDASLPIEPTTPPVVVDESDNVDMQLEPYGAPQNKGLTMPYITELLPNPATPMTDISDEFIEIYNPNKIEFELKGFSLAVGKTANRSYVFSESVVLPALGYSAFKSSTTRLALGNSGGQARLINPLGTIVSETESYPFAEPGQSWILLNTVWQWTMAASPNAANVLAKPSASPMPASAAASASTAKGTAVKANASRSRIDATPKKAVTKKPTAKQASAKKTVVKKARQPVKTKTAAVASVKPKPPIHMGILVVVAILAVLYGLYEYRQDIANKYHQLKSNRGDREQDRRQTSWR